MTPKPTPTPVLPSAPDRYDWDDDARTCARYDDRYWDDQYNRDEDS
ncbi:hypothetical protein ACFWH4_01300 [Streptomyces sp. NPDC127091]